MSVDGIFLYIGTVNFEAIIAHILAGLESIVHRYRRDGSADISLDVLSVRTRIVLHMTPVIEAGIIHDP